MNPLAVLQFQCSLLHAILHTLVYMFLLLLLGLHCFVVLPAQFPSGCNHSVDTALHQLQPLNRLLFSILIMMLTTRL